MYFVSACKINSFISSCMYPVLWIQNSHLTNKVFVDLLASCNNAGQCSVSCSREERLCLIVSYSSNELSLFDDWASTCSQLYFLEPGLRSRRKNDTAPAPELFFSWTCLRLQLRSAWFSWVWLRLRSSPFSQHGSGSGSSSDFCLFLYINVFNCLCVPQVEWKMKYIKCAKLK